MNVGIKTFFEGEIGVKVFEYLISISRVAVNFEGRGETSIFTYHVTRCCKLEDHKI